MKKMVLLCLALTGCAGNDGLYTLDASNKNVYRISSLAVGMSQTLVLQIMKQPYSHQSFERGESVYDIWFYITTPTVLGQTRMVPQNLTPLAFKDGILIGWGFNYYNHFKKQQEEVLNQTEGKPQKENPEAPDNELENTLKKLPLSHSSSEKSTSMSSKPKQPTEAPKTEEKKPEPKKPLLDEQDDDMLDDATDQDFNQT